MSDEWPFESGNRRFGTFFMKNALKTKEKVKKQDYFSQKVTFRA